MYVCMFVYLSVCTYVWHSIDGFTSLFLITPVFQIESEIHSNITSNTDKIQGKHFHNHFPALSFTTSFPFPLSFAIFFHIPFPNFAFCPNSVSEGNWEHVGLSGPIISNYYFLKFFWWWFQGSFIGFFVNLPIPMKGPSDEKTCGRIDSEFGVQVMHYTWICLVGDVFSF